MRTRWLILALGLSFAVNVALGVAFARAWWLGRSTGAAVRGCGAGGMCDEERRLHEQLAGQLCASRPDRRELGVTLARLDEVRSERRRAALERFIATCEQAGSSERSALHNNVRKTLCPWCSSETGKRAPEPSATAPHDRPAH